MAINNGKYGYEEIRDFERSKSSEIVKIDYEVCAIQESLNSLFTKIDNERRKIVQMTESLWFLPYISLTIKESEVNNHGDFFVFEAEIYRL